METAACQIYHCAKKRAVLRRLVILKFNFNRVKSVDGKGCLSAACRHVSSDNDLAKSAKEAMRASLGILVADGVSVTRAHKRYVFAHYKLNAILAGGNNSSLFVNCRKLDYSPYELVSVNAEVLDLSAKLFCSACGCKGLRFVSTPFL